MKKFFFDCGTRDVTASIGIFALRVMIGSMMLFGHGITKIQGYAKMKDQFYVPDFFPLKYMSPPVSLMAAISGEAIAAGCIIIGFATRPAAFVLAFTMVVAAFGVLGNAPWFMGAGAMAKEPALLYLIPMIVLILSGAGSWSLDAGLYKEGKRRRW